MVSITISNHGSAELSCDEIHLIIAAVRMYRLKLNSSNAVFDPKIEGIIKEQTATSIDLEHKLHSLCG